LVFGHNRHLQRHPSTWRLADMDLHWSSGGGIIATLLDNRYTFITGSLGASTTLPVPAPTDGTFEGALQGAMLDRCGLFDGNRLRSVEWLKDLCSRTDVGPNQGYFPLDADTLDHCDAVIHLTPAPSLTQSASSAVEDLTGEICALPDVEFLEATAENCAPESNWGNRFFYVGPDRMRPFATIVIRDMRGFDEDSNLDRASVFRLNIDLGRDEFQRQFGYPPAKFADYRPGIDFTQLDILTPHPMYGRQAWASIINPNPRRQDIDQLISQAHGRAQQRENRRQHRQSAARGRAR
jgi:Family of unknown function (DUF6194)